MYRFVLACYFVFVSLYQTTVHALENHEKPQKSIETTTSDKTNAPPAITGNRSGSEKVKGNVYLSLTSTDNPSLDDCSIKIAQKSNLYALLQTIFSGIGLVLVGFATVFAWGAWRAGKDAVVVTEKIGMKQTKAYLHVEKVRLWATRGGRVRGEVIIFNTGNSPALNLKVSGKISARFNIEREGRMFVDSRTAQVSGWREEGISIPAHGKIALDLGLDFATPDEDREQRILEMIKFTLDRHTNYTFIGTAEWEDVFGEKGDIYFAANEMTRYGIGGRDQDWESEMKVTIERPV